jgi:peptidyl-dipeptidase A
MTFAAAPTSQPAKRKANKQAAKAKAKAPAAKRSTTSPSTPAPRAKAKAKPAPLTAVEIEWQIDAWETQARAAWVLYTLQEWKKYTRNPKVSTKESFAAVTKLRKNKAFFAMLSQARKSLPAAKHPVLRRRVDRLWEELREYHLSAKINTLRAQIHTLTDKLNGIQASFRATYKGKATSNRDLGRIIQRNPDRSAREAAWRAYASVGPHVLKGGFMKLVRLRNAYAKQLGFKSFFHYRYHKLKLNPTTTWALFETLRKTTQPHMQQTLGVYRKLLKLKTIMPWDNKYARFVRAKKVLNVDSLFAAKRLLPILFKAYKEMGFALRSMNIKMDLYPRPNKNQHAYCFDIDPPHDVRIMANVGRSGMRPYETLFHEMGHAVHAKLVRQSIRTFRGLPEEGFLNEGSANFFGNIVNTHSFFKRYLGLKAATLKKIRKMKQDLLPQRMYLIRWTLIWMYFERDLYTTHAHVNDPTPQFWKRYKQLMGAVPPNAPPFWGMLIHYVSHPIYYQNYLLADMIAAQLHHVVKQKTKRNHILGNDRVAGFLTKHFFGHGKYYRWDELLKRVTGKPLNANAYLLSLRNDWR